MSLLRSRPLRWIAGGTAALIVTIYSALMLGLNVPAVRAVPLQPWADAGYGADRNNEDAAAPPAAPVREAAPASRVAGVRVATGQAEGDRPPSTPPSTPSTPEPPPPPLVTLPSLPVDAPVPPPLPGGIG